MKKDHNPFAVDLTDVPKEKIYYSLAMFPYPSGAWLHVWHAMNFTANDIIARYKRMQWYSVINPIGWDSFGLPTEWYAMKVGKPAAEVTEENIANFIKQCELMDRSYDRDREFATSSPEYYKRTQWIFQQLFKAWLVYRKEAFVNRCPQDQTVLANDQVVDGKCERCGTEVTQKKHMQRFIKITDYAERLIDDLDTIDWPEETKTQQKYRIGKSEGAEIDFKIVYDSNKDSEKIVVGTEHPEEEKRHTISAVVQRKSDGKFLLVKWEKHDWISPSIGWIDEWESAEAAAEREVLEETGYKVKAMKKLWGIIESHFFAENKNIWRGRYDQPVLLELTDENPAPVGEEEKEIQEPIWLTYEELLQQVTHKDNLIWFVRYMNEQKKITVFTTRPDTLYGVTALVLAPENETLDLLLSPESKEKLTEYRKTTWKKTALERQQDQQEKSGMFSGINAVHPLTGEQVPVWYADYVLPDYATGAVMFVPAHDERDFAFAVKHNLLLKEVIAQHYISWNEPRTDKETSVRKNVLAMLYNEDRSKVLCLDWWKMNRRSFVMWWVEEWEDWKDAWLREIIEETWYTDLEFENMALWEIHAEYFAQHKDINRYSKERCLIYRLRSDANNGIKQDSENHTLHWIPVDEVAAYLSDVPWTNSNLIFFQREKSENHAYTWIGKLINSWQFDWLDNTEAKEIITKYLEENWLWRKKITYKLRDWSISRQRYWGCPIPVYYNEKWTPQLIPENELPVLLPLDLGDYKPAGKSPLADHPTFPYYTAKDGNTYLRECDTLDTFIDSSFYYLRFIDPKNEKQLINKDLAERALPVDFYIGGKEHTYGHLLYSRFIHKFLFDQWIVTSLEPFQKLFHQWMLLGPDGRKMSKRWGNIIIPEDLANKYGQEKGIDILRTYSMFMWPLEIENVWNDGAVDGVKRFLERVERLEQFVSTDWWALDASLHKTIKWVTDDIERLKFNTAVSKLMVFVNDVYDKKAITKQQLSTFLQLLAPFATRVTEVMRAKLWNEWSIHFSTWPIYDPAKIAEDTINLPIQIWGKMRGTLEVSAWISEDEVMQLIRADERFIWLLEGKQIGKIIYVQDKIINLIVK